MGIIGGKKMTEEFKVQILFNSYLGSPNDYSRSQAFIRRLDQEFRNGHIQLSDIIDMLIEEMDRAKRLHQELVENNCTPPPIVIAPETEEGKALLKSIIEMQNKKT